MDGIKITQVMENEAPVYLDMSAPALANIMTSGDQPFDRLIDLPDEGIPCTTTDATKSWSAEDKELEAEQIADMIRINEGLDQARTPEKSQDGPPSPQFKHLDKLTPDIPLRRRMLSTKTLKKSFFKKHLKRGLMSDDDDSDTFLEPLRKKFKTRSSMEIKNRLAEEKRQLKQLMREKKQLLLENKKLKKDRLKQVKEIQQNSQIMSKLHMSGGLKKRGRPLGSGKKYREKQKALERDVSPSETPSEEEKELVDDLPLVAPTVIVKTRSGRTRKTKAGLSEYVIHSKAANFVYTGGLDRSKSEITSEPPEAPTATDPPPVRVERRGRKKGWRKLYNLKSKKDVSTGLPCTQISEENSIANPAVSASSAETTIKPVKRAQPRNRKEKLVMYYRRKKRRHLTKNKKIVGYGTEINFVEKGANSVVSNGSTVNLESTAVKEPVLVVQPQPEVVAHSDGKPKSDKNEDCSSVKAVEIIKESKSKNNIVPNGIKSARVRRVGLSKKKAKPLEDELSELRTVWGDLMGTSPVENAIEFAKEADDLKLEDNGKPGVENDSPPIANERKSQNSRTVSRGRKRKFRSIYTAKRRIRNRVLASNESSKPLKEKQNIDEALRMENAVVTSIKRDLEELPRASSSSEKANAKKCLNQEVPANYANVKVVLTKNQLVESSLSQQREEERLKQIEWKSEKAEPRKTRNSVKINSSLQNKNECHSIGRDRTPIRQGIATKSTESTPRRSGREIKLTEKMVDLITQEKQERQLNTEKMECYEQLLKRGIVADSENVPSDLGAKVEILSKHFECTWYPGDMVWTRIGDYPFWPSLVMQDPFCFDEYSKVKCLNGEPFVFVHVQFLHDRGRRAWVPTDHIMAFQGQDQFSSLAANNSKVLNEAYQKALIINDKHCKAWNEAVKEGEMFLQMTAKQRVLNIRRRNPLERYGDCSTLVGDVTEIPVELETLPPPPAPQEVPVKKSRTKNTNNVETVPQEKAIAESPVVDQKPKNEKKKTPLSKSGGKKNRKLLDLAEKIRAERAPSEDSTSAFEKESTSSLEMISLETKRAKKFLFKGVGDEKICDICRGVKNELSVKCKGRCQNFFHPSCLEQVSTPSKKSKHLAEDWICAGCAKGQNSCFVCKRADGTRQMCLTGGCGKFYHHGCLKLFPQTKFNRGPRKNVGLQRDPDDIEEVDLPPEILACPLHTCHTCSSDNPAEGQVVPLDKLVRCVKCPTSYHSGYFCVPAGTEVKTTSQILCGKHFEPPPKSRLQYHFNINWCFLCCKGGSLICCDTCPSSFHADCLKMQPPEESFICEECESGRFPLHGEVVWAKVASYRWWPARILYPQEIPQNLANMKRRQCEFAVQFYGSRDYQWVNRGRAFLYQEGDAMNKNKTGKGLDNSYKRAVAEANNDFCLRKEALSQRESSKSVGKPPPYVKIKTNKYITKAQGGVKEPLVCECDPHGEAPCSPNSNCLNRMLLFECDPDYCPAGKNCMNRCFDKRQYPPLQAYKTSEKGWGLRSKVDLVKGQFVIEYVGEVIDEEEFKVRLQKRRDDKDNNFYFLTLDGNRVIDAGPRGNLARFMNHSCDPNCETQKWTVNGLTRVGLFAIEDIPKETELTFNYNLDCLGDERKKECHCGSAGCSGFIGSKPIKAEPEPKKSKKIKSKKTSRSISKTTDSTCFTCGEGGELMLCDAASCSRACHVACAGLSAWPNEPWFCLSHKCVVCKKATKRCCSTCGVAYCSNHTQGYIFTDQCNNLFCSMHINKNKNIGQNRRSSYLNRRGLDGVTSSTGSIAGDLSEKDGGDSVKEEKVCPETLTAVQEVLTDNLIARTEGLKEETSDSSDLGILKSSLSCNITGIVQEDTGSEFGMDDLIPATDFNSSSAVIFTDPDGHIIDIDPESLIRVDAVIESPTKRKKRTNIPRAKIFGFKNHLPQGEY